MRRICVFCGSNPGASPVYAETARALGETLAGRGLGLVYGGGNVGLMGAVADGALAAGGEVIGVIPHTLVVREVAHRGLTELRVVDSMHAKAQKAAEASLCANDQGKFWEMHDSMFQNQQALAVDALKAKAAELGLNAEAFNSCLDSNKYAAQVATDMKEGSAAGVSGTPALFVNGRFISGAVPLEQITEVIDDELRRKGGSESK